MIHAKLDCCFSQGKCGRGERFRRQHHHRKGKKVCQSFPSGPNWTNMSQCQLFSFTFERKHLQFHGYICITVNKKVVIYIP